MNIVLMGLRGSGKSTIGRALAERLGRRFVELDDRVLAAVGFNSVTEAWAALGEHAWREAESAVLRSVLRARNQIIALGGGTPTAPGAAEMLNEARATGSAIVMYLTGETQVFARRLLDVPGDRPSLTGAPVHEELVETLRAREPLYRSQADHEVDVAQQTVSQAVEEIVKRVS